MPEKKKRGRPRIYNEDGTLIDPNREVKRKVNNVLNGKKEAISSTSNEDYCKKKLGNILSNVYIKIDSKSSREFKAFQQERLETGIDHSLDLFDKEIDKWPM